MIPRLNASDAEWAQYAAKCGKRLMNVPMQNGGTARMLWNANAVDCWVTNCKIKDKEMFACGARGSAESMTRETVHMLSKLQKIAATGFDVMESFIKHCH